MPTQAEAGGARGLHLEEDRAAVAVELHLQQLLRVAAREALDLGSHLRSGQIPIPYSGNLNSKFRISKHYYFQISKWLFPNIPAFFPRARA